MRTIYRDIPRQISFIGDDFVLKQKKKQTKIAFLKFTSSTRYYTASLYNC
jgi:hypothetical protein